MLSKCPGKKDIFKELRVRFVIFPKIIISESFFVSNNFVSEGMLCFLEHGIICQNPVKISQISVCTLGFVPSTIGETRTGGFQALLFQNCLFRAELKVTHLR